MLKKKIFTYGLVASLTLGSLGVYAQNPGDEILSAANYTFVDVEPNKRENLERILKRYADGYQRPEACPMNSTNYSDIVAKINDIKTLFKDNCPEEEQTALDQLVNSATEVQSELQNAGVDTSGVPSEINGQELTNVVSGINDIFLRGKCSFKKGTFLENTADVIFKFSQLGLLVNNSNGLLISGGGLALSSILRLINNLFKKKFSFEQTEDRQSFIKLNCAFYDIRRDIENSGFMDVSTDQHREDVKSIESLLKEVEKTLEGNQKLVDEFEKKISDIETKHLKSTIPVVYNLVESLNKFKEIINQKIEASDNYPANANKLKMIYELMGMQAELVALLNQYDSEGLAHAAFMDLLFMKELKKLDPNGEEINELIALDAESFNKTFRGNTLFHTDRILAEIEETKKKKIDEYYETTIINGVKLSEFLKKKRKENADMIAKNNKEIAQANVSFKKLKRITEGREFTRDDDGTDNIVAILSDYDNIAEQVYGKWGYEFLKYTSEKSLDLSKNFNRNFKKFSEKYLEKVDGKFFFRDQEHVDNLQKLFACQDAKPYRRQWKYSHSLAQEGYDFIATNKELFHSDIPRVFLGFSAGRVGVHDMKSKFEKIQYHQKSSVYARMMLNGEEVDRDLYKKYIKNKKYIGRSMIEVKKYEQKAEILQKLIENYNCSKLVSEDL